MTEHASIDFGTLFREFHPFVWRVLRHLGVAESDVEDVTQEVFLVVHRKLAGFEGRSSMRSWVYGICIRRASEYRRSRRRKYPVHEHEVPDQPVAGAQEVALAARDARALLQCLLKRLDDEKRTVFVLFEIEGLDMNAVASIVGCPRKTAFSRLYAAREIVRSAYTKLNANSEGGAR